MGGSYVHAFLLILDLFISASLVLRTTPANSGFHLPLGYALYRTLVSCSGSKVLYHLIRYTAVRDSPDQLGMGGNLFMRAPVLFSVFPLSLQSQVIINARNDWHYAL